MICLKTDFSELTKLNRDCMEQNEHHCKSVFYTFYSKLSKLSILPEVEDPPPMSPTVEGETYEEHDVQHEPHLR